MYHNSFFCLMPTDNLTSHIGLSKGSFNIHKKLQSQSQLRNDKYIMMQYTNWINSTHSQLNG